MELCIGMIILLLCIIIACILDADAEELEEDLQDCVEEEEE